MMFNNCGRALAAVVGCGLLAACSLPYHERAAPAASFSLQGKIDKLIRVCDGTFERIRETLVVEIVPETTTDGAASKGALQDNKVVKAVMHSIHRRRTIGLRAVVLAASEVDVAKGIADAQLSAAIGVTASDNPEAQKLKLVAALDRVIAQRRDRLSRQDFDDFFELIGNKVGQSGERIVRYEAAYLNGEFVDRFGQKWNAPKPSWTVTDDQISESLTVLLEAVADEIFAKTPVWVGTAEPKPGARPAKESSTLYYPGGKDAKPTFLDFAERHGNPAGLTSPMDPLKDGAPVCGMTKLKMDALVFLSNRASTMAAAQSGLLLGGFGGTNVGLPIVMGKLSVGDNQTLQALFKALVAYIAKRGAYEASWHLLLHINEAEVGKLGAVLQKVVLKPGDDDKDEPAPKPKS